MFWILLMVAIAALGGGFALRKTSPHLAGLLLGVAIVGFGFVIFLNLP